jgi:deoxyribonuclease-4
MWRAAMPDAPAIARLRDARERFGLTPLAVHDNYLINLAAADPLIRRKSIAAFRGEIGRALAIGAEYLVAHPGSGKGRGAEEGIRAVADALAEAARGLRGGRLTILLENTAGAGSQLGGGFEELAAIRELAAGRIDFALGYCLDTAHCLAAGCDVASERGLRETVRKAAAVLGFENIPVIHANDSKAPLGARVDRHEHIGKGYIGLDGFRRIVNHPRLRPKAFILETPVEADGDDRRNLETLKSLVKRGPAGRR